MSRYVQYRAGIFPDNVEPECQREMLPLNMGNETKTGRAGQIAVCVSVSLLVGSVEECMLSRVLKSTLFRRPQSVERVRARRGSGTGDFRFRR